MVDQNPQEVIDEDDEMVKDLKEFGDEIYEAVITAFKDMNEYNPSGRYVVSELWNFERKRESNVEVSHWLYFEEFDDT